MTTDHQRTCNGFCLQQVDACVGVANLNFSPKHKATFLSIASHWSAIADECDGQRHPWTEWCHDPLNPEDSPSPNSLFVAHFIATYFPEVNDPEKAAAAYTRKIR